MSLKSIVAAGSLAFALAWSSGARAEPCEPGDAPFVELQADVAPPDRIIAKDLERHLRAELTARGIVLCMDSPSRTGSIAKVSLAIEHEKGAFRAKVEVVDAVTDKTVSRILDLNHLTPRARLLAVAASTDELLRASWVELAVADAPPPKMTPPPALLAAVRASLPAGVLLKAYPSATAGSSRFEVGVRAVGSSFPGLREAVGGRAEAVYWLVPRLGLVGDLGASYAISRSSVHGTASAHAISLSVGATVAILPRANLVGLDAELGLTGHSVFHSATAAAGARSSSAIDWAATARAGVAIWLRMQRSEWGIGLAALLALRPSVATDSGDVVTGLRGVGGEASVAFRFGR